jgi:hypothetical protein
MKAQILVRRWKESMLGWTEERKAAVLFASEETDPNTGRVVALWAVYGRGHILEGLSAEKAIAQGVAEEVVE